MAEVLGIISAIIAIVDATQKICEQVRDAHDLPEAFTVIHSQLPLVGSVLRAAEDKYPGKQTADEPQIEATLQSCRLQAEKLRILFEKVCPPAHTGRLQRYKKALENTIRDRTARVEHLWTSILRSLQVLETFHVFASLNAHGEIEDALSDIENVEDSLPGNDGQNNINVYGGSKTMISTGSGANQNIEGHGTYTAASMTFTQNHGPGQGTQ